MIALIWINNARNTAYVSVMRNYSIQITSLLLYGTLLRQGISQAYTIVFFPQQTHIFERDFCVTVLPFPLGNHADDA